MATQSFDFGRTNFVNGVAGAVLTALLVAALYFGRDIFIALALAVMLSLVLVPLANFLEDYVHLPRGISIPTVVLLAFALIFSLGGIIASQVTQLAGDLPRYEQNIREKIKILRQGSVEKGTLERAADVIQGLGRELEGQKDGVVVTPAPSTPDEAQSQTQPRRDAKPVLVEVRPPATTGLDSLRSVLAPLMHPLAMTGIIVIFVIFILLQREDLRNRFIKLAGSGELSRATRALDDAGRRLSKLFLTQVMLNAGFGLVIGTGLWAIGVPSAILWGILAGVLRFVPYIGAFISAVFPLALAAAVDPGWSMLLYTALLFIVLEPLVGHAVEPVVLGHSSGLSPAAVVIAATFWTALWGPVGLILATPLTVCLVVLGRHVESVKFLVVLLGDEPALSPPEMFYQRMLANDPDEVAENAEKFLEERPLSAFYDEVALRGLRLAQNDQMRGTLSEDEMLRLARAMDTLIEDLSEEEDTLADINKKRNKKSAEFVTVEEQKAAEEAIRIDGEIADNPILNDETRREDWASDRAVVCLAERSPLDAAASAMLEQLLSKHGLNAMRDDSMGLASDSVIAADMSGVKVVVVSCFNTTSLARVRHAIRRVRRRAPNAEVILGAWDPDADVDRKALETAAKADHIVNTLHQAVALLVDKAARVSAATQQQPPVVEAVRLTA